jgi:hypothetical protein
VTVPLAVGGGGGGVQVSQGVRVGRGVPHDVPGTQVISGVHHGVQVGAGVQVSHGVRVGRGLGHQVGQEAAVSVGSGSSAVGAACVPDASRPKRAVVPATNPNITATAILRPLLASVMLAIPYLTGHLTWLYRRFYHVSRAWGKVSSKIHAWGRGTECGMRNAECVMRDCQLHFGRVSTPEGGGTGVAQGVSPVDGVAHIV